jgi:nucleoside-triphosphatase THEP1
MLPGVIVLTGNPGCGKTTLANKIKDYLEEKERFSFSGYRTFFSDEQDGKRYLRCQTVNSTNESFCIAEQVMKPYRRIVPFLESFGRMSQILERVDPRNAIFIDEIGFLETLHDQLQQSILKVLTHRKNGIAVLRTGGSLFLQKLMNLYSLSAIRVTESNRESVFIELLNR